MRLKRAWVPFLFVPLIATVACSALLGDFSVGGDSTTDGGGGDGSGGDGASNGDGSASCTGTQTACGTECADLQTTAAHCGTCDHACATGFSCSGGTCGNAVRTMIAGGTETCAILQHGDIYCWGDNTQGQIGVGDVSMSHGTATAVAHDSKNNPFLSPQSLGLGNLHACAAAADGTPFCWGSNTFGQDTAGHADDGGPLAVDVPTQAVQKPGAFATTNYLYSAMSIGAAATHQCAITNDAGIVCWGNNQARQLGHTDAGFSVDTQCVEFGSNYDCSSFPFPAAFTGSVKQVAAGGSHTCVLDDNGAIFCWGASKQGQLGNGSQFGNGEFPTHVTGLDGGFEAISSGQASNCALKSDGTVWCWGYSTDGELGYPGSLDAGDLCCGVEGCFGSNCRAHYTPIQIPTVIDATTISVGCDHACATEKDGSVWCWGGNESGQLGRGDLTVDPTPAKIASISNAVGVAAGCGHTCAWTKDGKASCWGLNDHGQIGNGTVNSATPLPVLGLP